MNKYSYQLTDGTATIHEFIEAQNIQDAYGKVLSIIEDLNKVSSAYDWKIENIENSYFVGRSENDQLDYVYEDKCECECCN